MQKELNISISRNDQRRWKRYKSKYIISLYNPWPTLIKSICQFEKYDMSKGVSYLAI